MRKHHSKDKNEKEISSGLRGDYFRLDNTLGVKVFRKGRLSKAQREYLFNVYVQNELPPGLVVRVYACGIVDVYDSYLKKNLSYRPGIWMEHIDGVTCDRYAIGLGLTHNPNFKVWEAMRWGYESITFVPIIEQMSYIVKELQRIGLSCIDHEDNPSNFMFTIDKKVIAIDFSEEFDASTSEMRHTIYNKYKDALQSTVPTLPEHIDVIKQYGFNCQ